MSSCVKQNNFPLKGQGSVSSCTQRICYFVCLVTVFLLAFSMTLDKGFFRYTMLLSKTGIFVGSRKFRKTQSFVLTRPYKPIVYRPYKPILSRKPMVFSTRSKGNRSFKGTLHILYLVLTR